MAMSALSCSLTADPSGLHAASPPYSCWDLMHAVQLTRLLMGSMESRRFDADAQVGWPAARLGFGSVGGQWGKKVWEGVGRKGRVWGGFGKAQQLFASEDGITP